MKHVGDPFDDSHITLGMSATTSHDLPRRLLCCLSATLGSGSIVLDTFCTRFTEAVSHNTRFEPNLSPFRDQMKIDHLTSRRKPQLFGGISRRRLRVYGRARGICARHRATSHSEGDFRAERLSVHQCHGRMKTAPTISLVATGHCRTREAPTCSICR